MIAAPVRAGALPSLFVLVGCTAQVSAPKDAAAPPAPPPAAAVTGPVSFGLGADFKLDPIPAVAPLALEEVALEDVRLELLKDVKAARSIDRDPAAEPGSKAAAWRKVSGHAEPNPFQKAAEKRALDWQSVADAKASRAAQVATLKKTLEADRKRLGPLLASAEPKRRAELESVFIAAYGPFEEEIASWPAPAPTTVKPPQKPKLRSPVFAPLGKPDVRAQRFVMKADVGAHAQSFSVDTSDDLMSAQGGTKPTFDLSGFYAGGQLSVNVAEQSDLAIGLLAFGRYHVTTSLPDNTFVSGEGAPVALASPDDAATGAFVVGAGGRLSGNVTERIAMELGLTGGYLQFLPPESVPGCGPDETEWDPTLRGFQGEIFVGFEFYPLAIMSLGVSGRVGFGHAQGTWCVPGRAIDSSATNPPDTPLDVSSDSFSVGAQGEIGFHF